MFEIIFLLILITLALGGISLAPFVPTFKKDFERINKIVDLKDGDNFVEIGCGMAGVSSYLARKNPNANIIGIELSFALYLYSKIKTFLFGPKNLDIMFFNAFKYNFSNTNVVYVFGLPETVNGKLKDKLENELPAGAKYVSYTFKVENWKGEKIVKDSLESRNNIYVCVK